MDKLCRDRLDPGVFGAHAPLSVVCLAWKYPGGDPVFASRRA